MGVDKIEEGLRGGLAEVERTVSLVAECGKQVRRRFAKGRRFDVYQRLLKRFAEVGHASGC